MRSLCFADRLNAGTACGPAQTRRAATGAVLGGSRCSSRWHIRVHGLGQLINGYTQLPWLAKYR